MMAISKKSYVVIDIEYESKNILIDSLLCWKEPKR